MSFFPQTSGRQSILRLFAHAAILLAVTLFGSAGCYRSPQAKTNYLRSRDADWYSLNIDNPRKVGDRYLAKPDADSAAQSPSPQPIERFNYPVDVLVLARLADGSVIIPDYEVTQKFVPIADVTATMRRELHQVTNNHMWPVSFPTAKSIRAYVLLLKAMEEETGWRVYEFAAESLPESHLIEVPDLLSLPEVAQSGDQQIFETAIQQEAPPPAAEEITE